MSEPDSSTPGWYGKLPSLGDFASRRLAHELIEPWDAWLAEEIGELRNSYPDEWLQGYLDSPTWRFVLGTGVLGAHQVQPLAGILMPSVDRVGRYFPLTILAPLPSLPRRAEHAEALFNWLHALDDIAADAMQEDWPIDELEQALATRPAPQWDGAPDALLHALASLSGGDTRMVPLALPEARSAMAEQLADGLWHWSLTAALGRSISPGLAWWWADPAAPGQGRRTFLSRGLPSGHDFSALMGPGADVQAAPRATPSHYPRHDHVAEDEAAYEPTPADRDLSPPDTPGVNPLADLLGHTAPSAPIDFMPPLEPR